MYILYLRIVYLIFGRGFDYKLTKGLHRGGAIANQLFV